MLTEEAVNEVKRQAVAELHRAVAAAEVKATVTVTAERARLEKVINEVRTQARQEAFSLLNSQEDSTEVCARYEGVVSCMNTWLAIAADNFTREMKHRFRTCCVPKNFVVNLL
jgi:hypothetical protein